MTHGTLIDTISGLAKVICVLGLLTLALICGSAAHAIVSPFSFTLLGVDAGILADLHCIGTKQMQSLDRAHPDGDTILGLTVIDHMSWPPTRVYLLDRVCRGLRAFENALDDRYIYSPSHESSINGWDVESVKVLFHEAAHAHGIPSEQRAECSGVQGALREVGEYFPDDYGQARHLLLVTEERHRLPAYKLNGTCQVPEHA
jgi:hypothetical protein